MSGNWCQCILWMLKENQQTDENAITPSTLHPELVVLESSAKPSMSVVWQKIQEPLTSVRLGLFIFILIKGVDNYEHNISNRLVDFATKVALRTQGLKNGT